MGQHHVARMELVGYFLVLEIDQLATLVCVLPISSHPVLSVSPRSPLPQGTVHPVQVAPTGSCPANGAGWESQGGKREMLIRHVWG